MARFLFVQDNGVNENLGVMSIAGSLKAAGHDVDLLLADEHGRRFIDMVGEYRPDLVGFSFMTGSRHWAFDTARTLKQRLGVRIIFGGVHPTLFPEDIDFDTVDFVCVGEGEYPLLELLDRLEHGGDVTTIANLWVKQNGAVTKNPLRNLIQDFDQLPLPYRDIYYKYRFIRDLPVKRFITGLGCPFRCTFCHNPAEMALFAGKGRFVRQKSVGRVLAEIRDVRDRLPLRRVHFSDDLFGLNRRWLREFLPAYKAEIGLPFSCNMRIDLLDEDTTKAMAAAGCWGINYGIESGSDHIRNTILRKDLDEKDIVAGAERAHRHGIRMIVSNMFGLPEESLEDAFKTVELNQRIKPDYTRANVLVPYPKTEVADYAVKRKLLPADYDIGTFDQVQRTALLDSPHRREFENLCALFNLTVKLPWLTPVTRRAIHWPMGKVFSVFRLWEGVENVFYHQLANPAGARYASHIARNVVRDLWK